MTTKDMENIMDEAGVIPAWKYQREVDRQRRLAEAEAELERILEEAGDEIRAYRSAQARVNGMKNKRGITPEAQAKMQAARRGNHE
jgi:hypothetical protein